MKLQEIWNELDFAQRGIALENIFPIAKAQENVRWSLRLQFKNAHTNLISELPTEVQEGLVEFYKVRLN